MTSSARVRWVAVVGVEGVGKDEAGPQRPELAKLRQMEAFKTQFLNMAAHELSTPLTPLRLQLHLLLAGSFGEMPERQRRALEIAKRNADRIGALVKEVLEVARIEGGGMKFNAEGFDAADAVKEAVESFESTARTIDVQLTVAAEAGQMVNTDRSRLLQIVFNLVSNALKFTPAGGSVAVSAKRLDGHVEIDVADTGMGLTPEQQQRLFQPFVQVHDPMQITAPGTGLGLFISRNLAEIMGGKLTVTSPGPGRGTTFRLVIPQVYANPRTVPADLPRQDAAGSIAKRVRELI